MLGIGNAGIWCVFAAAVAGLDLNLKVDLDGFAGKDDDYLRSLRARYSTRRGIRSGEAAHCRVSKLAMQTGWLLRLSVLLMLLWAVAEAQHPAVTAIRLAHYLV